MSNRIGREYCKGDLASMGRRRRRVVKIVKKKLPTIFVCPACGEESVKVTMMGSRGEALVQCGSCKKWDKFPASPSLSVVDVYCMFADRHYGSRKTGESNK
ncbi:MAG: hypothetical protein ACUVTM_08540 [Candidatus Bathyarchaeia archaeon]